MLLLILITIGLSIEDISSGRIKIERSVADSLYESAKNMKDIKKSYILYFAAAGVYLNVGDADRSINCIKEIKRDTEKIDESSVQQLGAIAQALRIFDSSYMYARYRGKEEKVIIFYINLGEMIKNTKSQKLLSASIGTLNNLLNELEKDERLSRKYHLEITNMIKLLQDIYYESIPPESRGIKRNTIGE